MHPCLPFVGACAKMRRACLPVHYESNIQTFFENVSIMFKFHENLTTATGAVYKDLFKFTVASH